MYINLEPLFSTEGESRVVDYDFDMGDEEFASRVKVTGRIYNKTGIVYLDATSKYELGTVCALCSSDIKLSRETKSEHILVTHSEIEDDDDMYIIVEDMHFELNDLISEDIYLSFPSRFLCKDDCKGLCPMCGTNLNEKTCNCTAPTDPRWDALKELF